MTTVEASTGAASDEEWAAGLQFVLTPLLLLQAARVDTGAGDEFCGRPLTRGERRRLLRVDGAALGEALRWAAWGLEGRRVAEAGQTLRTSSAC